MTGVRARRVDDAEVKLDTAFYRLRERFFGSRVGSLAFSAVAFNLGTNRGMVCGTVSWFQLRTRLWRGNGCVQPKGRRKDFRMSCCRVHSVESAAYARAQREQIQLGAWPPARTSRPNTRGGPGERCAEGSLSGGVSSLAGNVRVWSAAAWSRQPKSTRRSCGASNSRVRQLPDRCERS